VVGELGADGQSIDYQAINSCIRFLPTLDGKELVTVESLRGADCEPHPVQQAMVDCHASQCGFCTPGFVMSLFALYQSRDAADRETVVSSLSGNLCRCTGYRPIIDAGTRMFALAKPARWSRDDAQSASRRERLRQIARQDSLKYTGFHAPRSVAELATAVAGNPAALILAGGTDVGLWVTKQQRELPDIVHIGEVAELKTIEVVDGCLVIGAAVPLSRAWPAVVALYPALAEQAERFASPPIRNSATLCGNLANGSPIGDSLPAMLALDAVLDLRHGDRHRLLPLSAFYLDYQKKALQPGEFIAAVRVPLPMPGDHVASYKVAKRFDQDISAVCATFRLNLEGERVMAVRLAFGGLASTAKRAAAAEAALLGQTWNGASLEAAAEALRQDFAPLTDLRATGTYRLDVACNLLKRFQLETRGESVRLPATPATRVA
jgi:xanthine dehydrogenase small subunit